MNTNLETMKTTSVAGQSLDPPEPPEYDPGLLLWIDVETDGIDPDTCRVFEIGMRLTDRTATVEHERLSLVIHHDTLTIDWTHLKAIDMHVRNDLLANVLGDTIHDDPDMDPCLSERAAADRILTMLGHAQQLGDPHPAGTNVHYDLTVIRHLLARHNGERDARLALTILSYRWMDMTTLRLMSRTLDHDPYQDRHESTHRVDDCIDRDIREYRLWLDILNVGMEGDDL